MELFLHKREVFEKYRSNSQRIRVLTEDWASRNLFCPACSYNKIFSFPNNQPVADFYCQNCREQFQLKSQANKFGKKINDGAYGTMIQSIRSNSRPNFLFLHYDSYFSISDLFLIPSFFFTESIIQKRKPLSANAKRAGWTGCNILLEKIPSDGRINIIDKGVLVNREVVLKSWKKIVFMKNLSLSERGWTSDLMRVVRSIEKKEFSLHEVYDFEDQLSKEHPNNLHIRAKIRQQLQILRDKGFLVFKGNGRYSLSG